MTDDKRSQERVHQGEQPAPARHASRRGWPTSPPAPSPRTTRSSPSSTAPTCRTTATCARERAKKKLEKAYTFMIRAALPGGVVTPKQWLALDAIAGTYANGTLRLTTRQTFQFHGVIKSNLKRTMQAINAALLDTLAACGDVNRNVMAAANPYLSKAHAAALRARVKDQRASAAADRRLSRDLARRREGRSTRAARPRRTRSRSTARTTCRANSRS